LTSASKLTFLPERTLQRGEIKRVREEIFSWDMKGRGRRKEEVGGFFERLNPWED
jgi:hypothetical protein